MCAEALSGKSGLGTSSEAGEALCRHKMLGAWAGAAGHRV